MSRILWIDDEEQITQVGKAILTRYGYEVLVANTPSKGLVIVRELQPDLVITDYLMPEKTGKSLSKEINRINKKIKIILCSGSEREVSKEILDVYGITAFLAKPFSSDALIRVIKEVIEEVVVV